MGSVALLYYILFLPVSYLFSEPVLQSFHAFSGFCGYGEDLYARVDIVNSFLSAQSSKSTAGPLPNANQLRWQAMEMYAFIHYSLKTYTDQEWAFGNEESKLFNHSQTDCRPLPRVCKHSIMRVSLAPPYHPSPPLAPSNHTSKISP